MSGRRLVPVAAVVVLTACGSSVPAVATGTRPTATSTDPATTPPGPAPGVGVGTGARAATTVQPQPAPGSCHYSWVGSDPLPDGRCTPGSTDPRVSQADLDSTICRPGWSAGVRPPERVTAVEKRGSAAAYGYKGSFATGEYDHLIPLELGGSPNDATNLWVEPNDLSRATSTLNSKDRLEDTLHADVCAGRVSLAEAQRAIATDWVSAASRYVG